MRGSIDRILTSHAGSLPRPEELIELSQARLAGNASGVDFQQRLRDAVHDVVARQREVGVDLLGDGEYGKLARGKVDYGSWGLYMHRRLGGIEFVDAHARDVPRRSAPGRVTLTGMDDRRDRVQFARAYHDPTSGITTGPAPEVWPVCTGPLTYTGHEAIRADIANFTAALDAAGVEEGFMSSVAPGSCARFDNEFYDTEEEFLYATAEALRDEYRAIIDAGLILQLDDPCIAENWDQINPAPSVHDYQQFTRVRVDALNHAIRGLPQNRIRFHLCWGSWHGPHTTDIPMRDIVEVMLSINAGAYSFEAGNVRHEHEWKVWQDIKLPDGKIILPGVVSHATNVVEHPELVADRIVRFAELVGKENVVASSDCGFGGRIHPQIAWAKLRTLAEGAAQASTRLWNY